MGNKAIPKYLETHTARSSWSGSLFLAAVASFLGGLAPSFDAGAAISQTPLVTGQSVEPNIMLTLDDSGSMQFEIMPENELTDQIRMSYLYPQQPSNTYGTSDYNRSYPTFDDDPVNAFSRSSNNNKIYYDPTVDYSPWSNSDGSLMADADAEAAYWNPGNQGAGTFDLTGEKEDVDAEWAFTGTHNVDPIDVDCNRDDGDNDCEDSSEDFWPMVYWVYSGAGSLYDTDNYTRVEIRDGVLYIDGSQFTGSSGDKISELSGGLRNSVAEEEQNFANWFQYYRSRALLAKAGVGQAFSDQSTGVRVGFASINDTAGTDVIINGVETFGGSSRTEFFDDLYGHAIPTQGTPLRTALAAVGDYYSDNDEPWQDDDGNLIACRQSYNVLMTDGYWNGSDPSGIGNTDGTGGPTVDGYTYQAVAPYSDSYSDTLADVAMEYWKNDLRTDLANNLAPSAEDPATWQHLVNFTVGLGVFGTLDKDDLPGLEDGSISWSDPTDTEDLHRIDDLFHAAVNSRGDFFSAANPEDFAQALGDALTQIIGRTGSTAAATTNTGIAVQGEATVYQPLYRSGDWTGDLLAFSFDSGTLPTTPDAVASDQLDAQNWDSDREIITFTPAEGGDPAGGAEFRWSDLTSTQQTDLNGSDGLGEARLEYLRGDDTNEGSGHGFRERNSVLGDIVDSSPIYVADPRHQYFRLPGTEGSSYIDFAEDNESRGPMIYAGANDGMLHGFDGETLDEDIAYVPYGVYDNLRLLTDPGYGHRFYVNGTPTAGDAYLNGSWETVLVGSTGAGGRSVFALDITDPNAFQESNADSLVKWEIHPDLDSDYADLGYTFSRSVIVRMANGSWAAVFGNGYESADGKAVLYITDLDDGSLIKSFELDGGPGNGLSTPSAVDLNDDLIIDRIYAGDRQGNLWKVDVSAANPNNWSVAGTGGGSPLFTATSAGGGTQPITVRPEVIRHPTDGQLVLFGTGQFIEPGDDIVDANTVTQSFYGIWDPDGSPAVSEIERDDLQEQVIAQETTSGGHEVRITTNNTVDYDAEDPEDGDLGWYIDFDQPTTPNGERVIRNAVVRTERLIFPTLIPSGDQCTGGGTGWLMELNPVTGGRLPFTPFDVNNDGVFDADDYVPYDDGGGEEDVQVSGMKIDDGIPSEPAIVIDPETGIEYKFITTSGGTTEAIPNNPGPKAMGRQNWQQLK